MSLEKTFLILAVLVSFTNAWNQITISRSNLSSSFIGRSKLFLKEEKAEESSLTQLSDSNPCWQDFYDDDCSMSTIYAASFVAKDWIKSMPCASGLEDCDMPEELKIPNSYQDGVGSIDVMDLLGIKRADDLKP